MDFDVLIVGAGIAGCATALELRSCGWRVGILHQQQRGDWFESLSPWAVQSLNRLSVDVGAGISEVVAWWGSEQEKCGSYPGARIAQRSALADCLRKRTIEQGAVVLEGGKLIRIKRLGDRWRVESEAQSSSCQTLSSGYLVDATGRAAVVGRRLGAERLTLDQLFCISAEIDKPQVVGTWTESSPNGWWNLCCGPEQGTVSFFSTGSIIRESRRELVAHFQHTQHLRHLLSNPRFSNSYARPCSTSRLAPCAGPGWVSVGDAAWTVQPLASAGVSKALRDARLVARVLKERADIYDGFQTTEFTSYLAQLSQQYALEKRWISAPFWQRPDSAN